MRLPSLSALLLGALAWIVQAADDAEIKSISVRQGNGIAEA